MVFGRLDPIANELRYMNRQEQKRTGTTVLYTPRRRCSCLGKTRVTDVSCKVCDGYGWWWSDGDEVPIRAIVQGATFHRDLMAMGLVQQGDLVIQFDRDPVGIAPEDRVRLDPHHLFTFATAAEAAVLERGDDPSDTLPQRMRAILTVDRTDPRTGEKIAYPETSYTWGIDTNVITWVADPQPGEGDQYSISYMADLDFVVIQPVGRTGIGPVGIQGKVLCSRRLKDARHLDQMREDPPLETDFFNG